MSEMIFTADQLDAMDITRRHLDACVVAGPGSGKTTVLVEYFRLLVAEGVDPLRILAITFTEKAAGNMRKKLAEKFHENSRVRSRLERAWVSTVHGFCARLLRENAVFAGVDPEFYVADARESWRLQQESMAKAMEAVFQEHPAGIRALIRGLVSYQFEEAVLSAYDAMRGAGVTVDQLASFRPPADTTLNEIAGLVAAIRGEPCRDWKFNQREQLTSALAGADRLLQAKGPREGLLAIQEFACNLQKCRRNNKAYEFLKDLKPLVVQATYGLVTALYAPQRELLIEILDRFDRVYRDRKRQLGALDFADLEEFSVRLLEDHAETRARLQGQFDHILMDEFQDTNGQQAKLLGLVRAPDRFYAVGDINQSIFGFRHAEPQGFREYRDEVARTGRHLVELIDNFRSRPEILRAVETILDGAAGIERRSLVAGRRFDDPRPISVEVLGIIGDEAMEARWVARRIGELLAAGPGFTFKDIALLVRNTEVVPEFGKAFDEAGIPYVVNRGKGFYESREVNDLTHLLRVIANPRDEVSLAVVLRSPLVGASDEALLRLKMTGDNIGAALMRLTPATAAEFGPDAEKLSRLVERLHGWRQRREFVSFDRLLLAAIDECGYPESPNLDKFLAQAREAATRQSLDAWVEELLFVRESNPLEPDAPPEDSANAVMVMTVHSAKGLEFPIVFVSSLHKGIDATVPVVAFSRQFGLGARWRNPVDRKDKDDLFQHAIRQERKDREAQESNRLFYVAMTRAEQHLVLSFSGNGKKPLNWAAALCTRLGIDPGTPREETVSYHTPNGDPWTLRLMVTAEPAGTFERPVAEAVGTAADKMEFLPLPVISGQQDANATVTALAKFAVCPRQYYLSHYLGFEGRMRKPEEPLDADVDLSAGEFGTQVHSLLAGTAVPDADPEAVRMAAVFPQSVLGRRMARASRVEHEFDVLFHVEDLVVRGTIDLWFEEGGEVVIVDYKTDHVSGMEAHQRASDYSLQLRLYALAVEKVVGRPPDRAWLHFLRPNTAIAVDLRPSLWESPEQVIRDFQTAQETLTFPLNEGERCRRCPFFQGLCPATLAEITRARPGPGRTTFA